MLDSILRLSVNEIQSQITLQRVVISNCLHNAQSRIILRHGEYHFRLHFGLDELGCDRCVTFKSMCVDSRNPITLSLVQFSIDFASISSMSMRFSSNSGSIEATTVIGVTL
jgi:hypothetical protein